jgi:tetrahydrodipicolinate N-succinyltransferase
VSLGHGAIVYGARIDDEVLIGMPATVLNGASIGSGSVVAAGSVVTPPAVAPPHTLVMGLPAKVVRQVTAGDRELVRATADHYVEYARTYRQVYGASQPDEGNAEILRLLRGLAVLDGLRETELSQVAGICQVKVYSRGQVITTQG